MATKAHNPSANVPRQSADEPRGDRGHGEKSWAPGEDEQGISNRPGDEESDDEFDEAEDDTDEEKETDEGDEN